jgi:PAS domain S-box-containing protein
VTGLYEFLEKVQTLVFIALGIVALVQWRRQRTNTTAWLLVTFGTLGLIVAVGQLLPERSDDALVIAARKLTIVLLVLFPYALWRFTITILPRVKWFWWTAHALTLAVMAVTLVIPKLPEEGEARPSWLGPYLVLLLTQWTVLSLRVSFRLWRAGKGQPTVSRRRMRTLSLGSLGMAITLLVAGTADVSTKVRTLDIAVQLLAILSALGFYLGFAPPAIVRGYWRRPEEAEAKKAERSLMSALTPEQVARALLPHVTHLTGGEGAVLTVGDHEIVGSYGLTAARTDALATALRERSERLDGLPVLSVPLDKGSLAVLASPYTPFFGREETEMLTTLAVLADLALARSELYETQAATQERLEEAQAIANLGSWEWIIPTEEISWSDEMYRIFGMDPATYKPDLASYMDAVHEEDKERVAASTKKILEDHEVAQALEHRIVRADGEVRWVVATTTLFFDEDGKPVRAIGTSQDITERKKAEEFRDQFIANAAHELRTPMTTLVGFVEMLTQGRTEMPEDRLRQIYSAMGRSGERLTVLISNLLDLSRLQQGALNTDLGVVNVKSVVDAALETTPAPEGYSVTAHVDGDVQVCGDKHRLLQVVSNLLTNAYRYGGRNIEMKVERNGTTALISVADDGPGVEKEIAPTLFDPFSRGSTSATVGGSGLGLAIVKALIEDAGGTVWHEPVTPHGARFCVQMEVAG